VESDGGESSRSINHYQAWSLEQGRTGEQFSPGVLLFFSLSHLAAAPVENGLDPPLVKRDHSRQQLQMLCTYKAAPCRAPLAEHRQAPARYAQHDKSLEGGKARANEPRLSQPK